MIVPCHFVIFGATGDLSLNKLLPALYHLNREDRLPGNMALVAPSWISAMSSFGVSAVGPRAIAFPTVRVALEWAQRYRAFSLPNGGRHRRAVRS